jgi:type I restriction enzyme R subunit
MFTIYDYTDATRLFGEEFLSKARKPREGGNGDPPPTQPAIISADGFEAEVSDEGRYVVTQDGGQVKRVRIEEYKQGLARRLLANTATLDEFREKWVSPESRRGLLQDLVYSGYSPAIVRQVEDMTEFDLYDVLVGIAYGIAPHTRVDRAFSFGAKQRHWLEGLPEQTKAVILAIAAQFGQGGTEAFENPQLFNVKSVIAAGGLAALQLAGQPYELIHETKLRLFAA